MKKKFKYAVGGGEIPTFAEWLQQTGQEIIQGSEDMLYQKYQEFVKSLQQQEDSGGVMFHPEDEFNDELAKIGTGTGGQPPKKGQNFYITEDKNKLQKHPIFQALDTAFDLTRLIAGTVNDVKTNREERYKYLEAIRQKPKVNSDENGINNIPIVFKKGGDKYKLGGTAELEKGEVFQKQDGQITKVPESEPTHEQGGSNQPFVFRVLEDTSDKRKDIDSKLLKINSEEAMEVIGVKIKKPVTHSKLYEEAVDFYGKRITKVEKGLDRALDYQKIAKDRYSLNTIDENTQNLEKMPSSEDLFDTIFDHQEEIKHKYGITNESKNKKGGFAVGGEDEYEKDPITGEIRKKAKRVKKQPANTKLYGEDVEGKYYYDETSGTYKPFTGTGKFSKQDPETYIGQLVDHSWDDLVSNKAVADSPENRAIYERLRQQKYPGDKNFYFVPNQGVQITPGDMSIPQPNNPKYNSNSQIAQPAKPSKFNEPLHWADVAGDFMGLLANSERYQVPLEQLDRQPLNYRELNPLPILQQGTQDYNAMISSLPNNGIGMANQANLFGKKYALNNQVLGNTQTANNQGKTNIDNLNNNNQFQLDQLNLGLRDQFNNRVLQGKEIQQSNKLHIFNNLFNTVAQNRKLNREGDLVMQMFPYFDQYGKFNGNKYNVAPNTGSKEPTFRQVRSASGRVSYVPVA